MLERQTVVLAIQAAVVLALLGGPFMPAGMVLAQEVEKVADTTASEEDEERGSFLAALAGGTSGSLAGGLVLGSMVENDCYDCYDSFWAFTAGSIIGSTAGAYAGTKLSGGKPSAFAAAIGATLGLFVGLGVAGILEEDNHDAMVLFSFAVTQGVGAALGAGQF
jgi:outer membrane lipoprotein SlyB